jgi:hypothetical protein
MRSVFCYWHFWMRKAVAAWQKCLKDLLIITRLVHDA